VAGVRRAFMMARNVSTFRGSISAGFIADQFA
jgi:hypothetical protein